MKRIYTHKRLADAVSWYRHSGVLDFMEGVRIVNDTDFEWDHFDRYADAVWVNRGFHPHDVQLMLKAKKAGIRTVLDIDDDMFNLPDYNATSWKPKLGGVIDHHLTCLTLADKVICSTLELKKSLTSVLKASLELMLAKEGVSESKVKYSIKNLRYKFHVVPNGLNDHYHSLNASTLYTQQSKHHILWRGSDTHMGDVDSVKSAIEKNANGLHWEFRGWNPYILEGVKYDWSAFDQDLFEYFEKLRQSKCHYLLVPLVDNRFNRAKSNIAWIEATWAGKVVIAPDLPEWHRPGIINYVDTGHLSQILSELTEKFPSDTVFERQDRLIESSKYISENLLVSNLNKKRYEIAFD